MLDFALTWMVPGGILIGVLLTVFISIGKYSQQKEREYRSFVERHSPESKKTLPKSSGAVICQYRNMKPARLITTKGSGKEKKALIEWSNLPFKGRTSSDQKFPQKWVSFDELRFK